MSRVCSLSALPDLSDLLASQGLLDADETPLTNAGYSGAAITRLERHDGARFMLKRMSIELDWIMRATDDVYCREAQFAAAAPSLPDPVRTPYLAAARQGDGYAVLMDDITPLLLPEGEVTPAQLDAIIRGMASLHGAAVPTAVALCGLRERLLLLTPETATIAASYGAPVAHDVTEGWRIFARLASPDAVKVIQSLTANPAPLLRALGGMPPAFLHGDLKFDNIGVDAEGRLWLIDWAMTLVAPAAVEIGWFLAINSRRLPVALDVVMAAYAGASGMSSPLRKRHDALAAVCGLLLRGWRKALDADAGDADELRWWCERVEAAAPLLV